MPTIVQFLHPFNEAKPPKGRNVIPWNNKPDHCRKFLASKGNAITPENENIDGEFLFWGEWEAQSRVEELGAPNKRSPLYINYPFLDLSESKRLHVTDPYVFGKQFKYYICRQGKCVSLKTLKPGSMLLFGSCINNKFCLDTLFVVSDKMFKYSTSDYNFFLNAGKGGKLFYTSIDPLKKNPKFHHKSEESCFINDKIYTLYYGVDFDNKDDYSGMFSFSPCKFYQKNDRLACAFKMPVIELDFISEKQTMGINSKECSDNNIISYWKDIRRQIENSGLILGHYFEQPPYKMRTT